jgi:hypothetical protein
VRITQACTQWINNTKLVLPVGEYDCHATLFGAVVIVFQGTRMGVNVVDYNDILEFGPNLKKQAREAELRAAAGVPSVTGEAPEHYSHTIHEAAEALGVSSRLISRGVDSLRIAHQSRDGAAVVNLEDVREFLKQ